MGEKLRASARSVTKNLTGMLYGLGGAVGILMVAWLLLSQLPSVSLVDSMKKTLLRRMK